MEILLKCCDPRHIPHSIFECRRTRFESNSTSIVWHQKPWNTRQRQLLLRDFYIQ